ncbi:hypothetical protein APHAL10511_001521 [Amanita phalloides]|nr:hypothetical protein APHAL10511_001521 [Amanita phalloides]
MGTHELLTIVFPLVSRSKVPLAIQLLLDWLRNPGMGIYPHHQTNIVLLCQCPSRRSSGHHTQFLSTPKAYGNESDSGESHPLMRKAQKTGNSSYSFKPTAPLAGRYIFEQHEASPLPRLRENGWVHTVANFEVRNERPYQAIMGHLELEQHKDAMKSASEGSELWVRDVSNAKRGFIPGMRWWVNHKERSVVFDKPFDVAVTQEEKGR